MQAPEGAGAMRVGQREVRRPRGQRYAARLCARVGALRGCPWQEAQEWVSEAKTKKKYTDRGVRTHAFEKTST